MPTIETDSLTPEALGRLSPLARQIAYNGLDCCLTHEIFGTLSERYNTGNRQFPLTYQFERALQGPILEMMLRGFRVDQFARAKAMERLRTDITILNNQLQRLAYACWDKQLNPRSPKQLIDFFHGHMRLPENWTFKKGEKKLSMDREALEQLSAYFYARPLITLILAIRDLTKQLSVLETEIDSDGRMRTSYNIAGTESGRLSSSSNAFGTGTNLQNITASLRTIFIADPGKKLCGIDLEQAESREVGWILGTLFGRWEYLDACYAGDLHTTVCRMAWKHLSWTGDRKRDREIADTPFYRTLSYRDLAKKLGHGSNYYGKPPTMARHAKIPISIAAEFQAAYFSAFHLPLWHQWTKQRLQTTGVIRTVFGRERHFFGRLNDDTTLREAIAYSPQSATADRMDLILYRIWHTFGSRIQLIAQVHDAIYFQYDEQEDETELIPAVLALFDIPIEDGKGHKLVVPGEAKVGWNWGNFGPENPDGLAKWKGVQDERIRTPIHQTVL